MIDHLPSIVQLKLDYKHLKAISGVRFDCLAKVIINDKIERKDYDEVLFTDYGISEEELRDCVRSGRPFITSGCPDCNRPYYNEKPGGPLYNYPRQPLPTEIDEIEKEVFVTV